MTSKATMSYTIRMGCGNQNSGEQEAQYRIARQLLRDWAMDTTGGYTSRNVSGGWRCPDTDVAFYEDAFEITFDDIKGKVNDLNLESILLRCKELTGEEAIYLSWRPTFTTFI